MVASATLMMATVYVRSTISKWNGSYPLCFDWIVTHFDTFRYDAEVTNVSALSYVQKPSDGVIRVTVFPTGFAFHVIQVSGRM
jgi:hypothetical protein